jgi:hypothetical protein
MVPLHLFLLWFLWHLSVQWFLLDLYHLCNLFLQSFQFLPSDLFPRDLLHPFLLWFPSFP